MGSCMSNPSRSASLVTCIYCCHCLAQLNAFSRAQRGSATGYRHQSHSRHAQVKSQACWHLLFICMHHPRHRTGLDWQEGLELSLFEERSHPGQSLGGQLNARFLETRTS